MKYILSVLICGMAFSVSAQMIDLIGSGAVGGALTKESTTSINQGMNALKYTQMIQALSQNAAMIKIKYMGDYAKVGRSDIAGNPFKPYQFNVGSSTKNRFFIELIGIEQKLCHRLVTSGVGAQDVEINGQGKNSNACTSSSQIKFIFD